MCLNNNEKEMASTLQTNEQEHKKIPSLASSREPNIYMIKESF